MRGGILSYLGQTLRPFKDILFGKPRFFAGLLAESLAESLAWRLSLPGAAWWQAVQHCSSAVVLSLKGLLGIPCRAASYRLCSTVCSTVVSYGLCSTVCSTTSC